MVNVASAEYVFELIKSRRYSEAKRQKVAANFTWGEVLGSIQSVEWGEVKLEHLQNARYMAGYMQALRDIIGPIKVTSWYRTFSHNRRVGGAQGSFHLKGLAVDFIPQAISLDQAYNLLNQWQVAGGLGDGRARGFIHLDLRGTFTRFGY